MKEINKDILALAVPSIVSNITVPLLGLVDLTIVGHIGNENYIGAIAVGSMIFNVIYWVLGFLRMGTSGMTSQAYGRSDFAGSGRILLRALAIGWGMGIAFIVCQQWMESAMSFLLHTPQDAASLVSAYFRIVIWGAPAMLGLYGLTGWFVGMQNTRVPMMVAIVQNVVNIACSLFFVYALGWRIEGVAAGTLIAQWAGFLMASGCLVFLSRPGRAFEELRLIKGKLTDFIRTTLYEGSAWKRFFVVNRDIFLRTLCLVAVNMTFTAAGGRQGAMMLAVNTLLMTMFTLFSYVMDGFAYAGEALSGKYYGAGDRVGLHRIVRQLFLFGAGMVVLFTAVYVAGGTRFLHFLTDDGNVVLAAQPYLLWAYLIPTAGVAAFIFDGVFIGITETKGMLASSMLAAGIFFAVYREGWTAWGNHALWLAFLLFLSVRGITQWFWARVRVFPAFRK